MFLSPVKPDPRRTPNPYALQARVSPEQYAVIVAVARDRQVSMSNALRQVIDEWQAEHGVELDGVLLVRDVPAPEISAADRRVLQEFRERYPDEFRQAATGS
jgi:transposase-like protein